jgi:hypothetical protein
MMDENYKNEDRFCGPLIIFTHIFYEGEFVNFQEHETM